MKVGVLDDDTLTAETEVLDRDTLIADSYASASNIHSNLLPGLRLQHKTSAPAR